MLVHGMSIESLLAPKHKLSCCQLLGEVAVAVPPALPVDRVEMIQAVDMAESLVHLPFVYTSELIVTFNHDSKMPNHNK